MPDSDSEQQQQQRNKRKNAVDLDECQEQQQQEEVEGGGEQVEEGAKLAAKRRKHLAHESVYLKQLPNTKYYERSYMHRAAITHLAYSCQAGYLITASCDGTVKFWTKCEEGVEFVKHFRAHLAAVADLAVSWNGELCATLAADARDKSLKVFDIGNFDMINMMKLAFWPHKSAWIFSSGDPVASLAVTDRDSPNIFIFDARGSHEPLKVIAGGHDAPVAAICFNAAFESVVSADTDGVIEYWTGPKFNYGFPSRVQWNFKTDTDLFDCCKSRSFVTFVTASRDGRQLACACSDNKIRIFHFLTGKLRKVIDESLQSYTELQQRSPQLPDMEFGKRMAVEKELMRTQEASKWQQVVFDDSGHFLMYPTLLGIKLVNLHTNRIVQYIGQQENVRFLSLALCQSMPTAAGAASAAAHRLQMELAGNPLLKSTDPDPTLFCSGYKRNRFFLFSRREPDHSQQGAERDIFNEKPTKDEILAATEDSSQSRLASSGTLHTTFGDISFTLFAKECPRTVENFTGHCRNGFYNGLIFHRVIKGFMVQTGCPLGNGTGGHSIWGGQFEDEIVASLRHDRPYTMSMANAGPNTNGSQFFITVAPAPSLDGRHSVFGRVTQGMDVVNRIAAVKTSAKTDKPHEDIKIISVSVK